MTTEDAAAAEITALRAKVDEAAKREGRMLGEHANKMNAIYARVEAAEADAARYRWLRQWVTKPNDMPAMPEPETVEQFDAAIDAAMSERKEKP
jgi:hypothetical protein